jgi:heavy metal sensor kinase
VPNRLPIRLRLTLAFALVMAVVLTAMSVFLLVRLRSSLDESIDEDLRTRAAEGAAVVTGSDERLTQILDLDGRLRVAAPSSLRRSLLGSNELSRAARGPIGIERASIPGLDGRVRLRAQPAIADGDRVIVVVGISLEERDEAVSGLTRELLIAGPIALLLASLGGYWLATASLRPVESMRAEAAAISGADPGRRLPLPRSDDEISRLGETLNEMLGRLEATLERERGFVANASHELRTPLAVLKTELELALRRPRSPEELEAALRSAAEESDRLSQLAEDLLVLARADEDGLPLRRTTVAAQTLLDRVAERFASRALDAGRTVDVEVAGAIELEGDPVRLEQALGNLVDNALRHGAGPARLHAFERGGRVELHVLDAGPGFRPDFLSRAFERFSRADEARSRGGAGLGLAIVDVIARAHGGSAHAENRAEGGADMWLSLPARRHEEKRGMLL